MSAMTALTLDSLGDFTVFVQVAETRSFAETGRLTGVSASAVGKRMARLEERLGVRLFHRSTRCITLTAEGSMFLARCRRVLAEIQDAELELSQSAQAPRGRLKVSLPLVGSLFLPLMADFMQAPPGHRPAPGPDGPRGECHRRRLRCGASDGRTKRLRPVVAAAGYFSDAPGGLAAIPGT